LDFLFTLLRKALGLQILSIRKFFTDIIISPFVYLGSWVFIILVLIPYVVVLQLLGVDLNKGAHPVVPVLLESSDMKQLAFIVILGVIIAPAIEELMFRGALYSALRSKFGAGVSIFFSSLIFASVHPQGIVGSCH
jgi:uncharacterized protein